MSTNIYIGVHKRSFLKLQWQPLNTRFCLTHFSVENYASVNYPAGLPVPYLNMDIKHNMTESA